VVTGRRTGRRCSSTPRGHKQEIEGQNVPQFPEDPRPATEDLDELPEQIAALVDDLSELAVKLFLSGKLPKLTNQDPKERTEP
jgi:hypothetical protein